MSHSSVSDDLEKDQVGNGKPSAQPHLTEAQEDLIDAGTLPFTEKDDVERDLQGRDAGDGDGEGGAGDALSRMSSRPSVNNIKSVPNGGLRAWLQVLSSFFVFFNVSRVAMLHRRSRTTS